MGAWQVWRDGQWGRSRWRGGQWGRHRWRGGQWVRDMWRVCSTSPPARHQLPHSRLPLVGAYMQLVSSEHHPPHSMPVLATAYTTQRAGARLPGGGTARRGTHMPGESNFMLIKVVKSATC